LNEVEGLLEAGLKNPGFFKNPTRWVFWGFYWVQGLLEAGLKNLFFKNPTRWVFWVSWVFAGF